MEKKNKTFFNFIIYFILFIFYFSNILAKENFFRDLIDDAADKVCENEIKQSLISVSPRYIFELLIVFFVIAFTTISIFNNKDLDILIPTIGVFAVAGLRVLPAGAEIMAQIARVDYVSIAINVTFEDLKMFSRNTNIDKKEEKIPSNYFSSVELKNVGFRYPNSSNYILKNLNLKIKKNEFIGIIGESGVGKSTFVIEVHGGTKLKIEQSAVSMLGKTDLTEK